MTILTSKGDEIQGTRIVLTARKIGDRKIVANSGAHKGQQVAATENARAWIEIPRRHILESQAGAAAKKKPVKKK